MSYDIVSCEELVMLTTEYFDGALEAPERLRFERHLAICPPCRAFLSQMRRTLVLAGSMPSEPLTEETKASLLSAFRRWKAGT